MAQTTTTVKVRILSRVPAPRFAVAPDSYSRVLKPFTGIISLSVVCSFFVSPPPPTRPTTAPLLPTSVITTMTMITSIIDRVRYSRSLWWALLWNCAQLVFVVLQIIIGVLLACGVVALLPSLTLTAGGGARETYGPHRSQLRWHSTRRYEQLTLRRRDRRWGGVGRWRRRRRLVGHRLV